MSSVLVSIITPTYNRAYILERAIQSVLSQTYKNWELIIVDDGSSDNTKALVSSFHDDRIKYYFQENQGHQMAKNNAMSYAKGQWLVYLDSDNRLRENHLSTMMQWIEKYPKTIWGFPRGTRFLELYEDGKLIKSIDDSQDFPPTVSTQDIVHRKLHTDMNGAFHSQKIIEDGIRFDS
jgi:glycosyltransferase involved in cell wall biosynthesis